MRFPFLFFLMVAISANCGCASSVKRLLAGEDAYLHREVSEERYATSQLVFDFYERQLRELEASPDEDAALNHRLIAARRADLRAAIQKWDEFKKQLHPGDRVFEAREKSGMVRYYVGVRDGRIVARTEPEGIGLE
jgi:hypothetical protein